MNWNKIKSYFLFFRWFIPDSVWRFKWASFAVLVADFLGVTLQVQVLGLIIYYAKHFASGEIIAFSGFSFDPRSSLPLLIAGSIIITISLLFSGACAYYSRSNALRIARRYQEFSAGRIFSLLGAEIDFPQSASDIKNGNRYVQKLVTSDARSSARILRLCLSMIIPIITFIVAASVIIYLEPLLTGIIAVLSILFIYSQYNVSNRAVVYSVQSEQVSRLSGSKYRDLINYFRQNPERISGMKLIDRLFSAGPVKKVLDAYEGRFRSVMSSQFVSDIFIAFVMGLIILIMGMGIIKKGEGWERLLVYIVALRFAMTYMQRIFSSITSINRFYPQARRQFLFMRNFAAKDNGAFLPPDKYDLRVAARSSKNALKGTRRSLSLNKGVRMGLVTPQKLNRYTASGLVRSIFGESGQAIKSVLSSIYFVISEQSCPYKSLRQSLALGAKIKRDNIKKLFPEKETWRQFINQFPRNLDQLIRPEIWDKVDSKNKFIFSLLSAVKSECLWVMIESRGLALLEIEEAKYYLDLLKGRFLIIVFNDNLETVGSFGEAYVAVANDEKLLGIGTPAWFAGVKKQAVKMLEGFKKADANGMGVAQDDDLDDE